jgi:hypothetical protein
MLSGSCVPETGLSYDRRVAPYARREPAFPKKHGKLENGFRRALDVTDRIDCDAQADAAVQRIDLLRQGDRIISRAVVASGLFSSA